MASEGSRMTRLNVHIELESPSKDRESVDGVAARGSQSVADLSVKFTLHAVVIATWVTP